ncbi:putative TolA protein [Balamuthia mandrillaris]
MGDLQGSSDSEKLLSLCDRSYKEQCIWFLNAYWDQFASNEAEKLWGYVQKCAELDLQRKAAGSALDELNAHRFLESIGETLTVLALRDKLRKTGAIGPTERPKVVPLTHYLLFRYDGAGVDWRTLVNTKGDNSAEIAEAQRLLDQVTAAFVESDRTAALAREAEAAAREQEAPFKAACEEVEAAVADVQAQEDSYNARTEELKRKSTEGGVVQQNKAKAELAQHLAEDPLPLRKAKITLEAAKKKADKARAPFEAATKAAEEARAVAEEALEQTRRRVEEAEEYLREVKAKPGTPHGAIWWLERELEEQKAYLPASKGGVIKRK